MICVNPVTITGIAPDPFAAEMRRALDRPAIVSVEVQLLANISNILMDIKDIMEPK